MKSLTIKIHSISDIITNSSSETFCFIYSKDISKVLEILSPYFSDYSIYDVYCAQIYGPFQEDIKNPYIEVRYSYGYIPSLLEEGLRYVLDKNNIDYTISISEEE